MSDRKCIFPLSLRAWVQERLDNCERIAATKTGGIREGWMEDASYFRAILGELDKLPDGSEAAVERGRGA